MEKDLTRGEPLGLILRFAIPMFIGNCFQQLYNMVDTVIVGRFVGDRALAAVGSVGTIFFLVVGASNGMAIGFTILTSQRFGAGDTEGTRRSVASGMLLSVCTACGESSSQAAESSVAETTAAAAKKRTHRAMINSSIIRPLFP